jgi:hypothetical protein
MPKKAASKKDIDKLKELIQADEALQRRLGAFTTGQELQAALAKVGAKHGLALTEAEIGAFVAKQTARDAVELSPEELVSLAGGFHIRPPKTATVQFGDTLIRTTRWFGIPLRRG